MVQKVECLSTVLGSLVQLETNQTHLESGTEELPPSEGPVGMSVCHVLG